jgi:Putative lumazine-binding
MPRILMILLSVTAVAAALAAARRENPDERAIRQHIERYYFEGVRNSDTALARKAFHPAVPAMYFVRESRLAQRTIPDWLASIAERAPTPPKPDTFPRKVVSVDVSHDAAIAKLQIRYADALVTDYMSLLKVDGQWAIIGKIFDRHPLSAQASAR